MSLLKKLEDSPEGLIGISEDGKRIHLGIPMPFSCIHKLSPGSREQACTLGERDKEEFEQNLRSDEKLYWYFNDNMYWPADDNGIPRVRYTYLGFEMEKQKAFESGSEGYIAMRDRIDEKFVRIKRE